MNEVDRIRVLVADSEEHIRALLADHLHRVGYLVDTATDHEEAVRVVQQAEGRYDLVLIDQRLPPDNGLETMKAIKALHPSVEVAIFTDESDRESALKAMREGAYGYIPKPLNLHEVAIFIESAAEHRRLRKALEATSRERELLHGVLNISHAVQSTLELDEVLETILSGVRQLGYDRVRLYLLSEEGKELKGRIQLGGRQRDFEGLTLPLEGEEADVYSLETLAGRKPRLYKAGELGPDRWGARLDKQDLSEWVELPLLAKGKPIGKITIDNKDSKRKVEESELDPLMLYANQAAMAIENARFFKETKRRLGEVNALFAVGKEITSTLDLEKVLQFVLESAIHAIPAAEKGSIYLFDERSGDLVIKALSGFSPEIVEMLRLKPGEGYAGWSFENQQPLILPDVHGDPRTKIIDHPEVREEKSVICVPLMVRGKAIGTLCVDNITRYDAFGENDLQLLSILASQAAVAIENATLFSETQRQMRELALLTELDQAMTSVLDLEQILTMAMRDARRVLGVEAASIWLLNEATGELICQAAAGGGEDKVKGLHLPLDQGIVGWVVRQGQPLSVSEVSADPRWCSAIDEVINFTTRSILAAPLEVRNKVIGVIEALNKEGEFTPDDMRLLSALASSAAIAIENARLFESTQNKMRQLDHLRQVGQALTGAITDRSKDVLDTIAQGACEVIGADCAVIYPYYADSKAYDTENIAAHGLKTELTRKEKPRIFGQSVTGRVMEQRLRVINDIVKEDPSLQAHRFIQREGIRAFIAIRLDVGGEAVGALFVNFRAPHQFTEDEQDTIQIFADQAATAIKKARLFERVNRLLERKLTEIEGIQKVDKLISSTVDLRPIWDQILDTALRVTGTQHGWISFVNERTGELIPEVVRGVSRAQLDKHSAKSGEVGVTGWVARKKKSALVGDVREEPWSRWYVRVIKTTLSELAVPVLYGDKQELLGVINIESPKRYAFDEDDRKLLEALADSAAIAIENARLYEREQRRAREAEALVQVGQAISSTLDLDKILETVAKNALLLLGLEDSKSTIFLLDEKTGDFVRSTRVPPREDGNGPRRSGGLTSLVIETGEPIVIPDVGRDPRVRASVVEKGVRSSIGVPLKVKERTIGVLFANTFYPRDFTQHDIEMLSSLANQAAVAIENAKQYEELRQAHEDLAAATTMAWLGISGAEWSHAVNQKTSAICYNVNTLRDLIHSPDEVSQEILDDIERAAQEIQNIPMKGPLPARTGEPVHPVVVDEVLQGWLPRWCGARTDVELNLQLCCGNEFACIDATWLAIALEKLVSNALKAMPNGGRLTVASRVIHDDRLEIIVEDTGCGIPEKALVCFLRERVPPEARRDRTGSGMGALIARFILRSYGGDLELLRTGGEGTALSILLPVARESP